MNAREFTPARFRISDLVLLFLIAFSSSVSACSIPVFRYALERWEPASYELLVFHRGPLTHSDDALLKSLSTNSDLGVLPSSREASPNMSVRAVDLDSHPSPELMALWAQQKHDTLPLMVLRTPRGSSAKGGIWSGPFTEAAVRQVLDSPVRQRLADRLLRGESAVWLFLESGDKAQDDGAAQLLQARIEHLQKALKLPEISPDDVVKHRISRPVENLKVAFSVLRLSRADPAEQVTVRMLLSSEEDLDETHEPMAFPVFGRGRALFALVGKGINHETIDESCSFVIGPCSCIVKDLNPGQDLLLSANWAGIARSEDDSGEAAPLPELRAGARVPIAPGAAPKTIKTNSPTTNRSWVLAQVSNPTVVRSAIFLVAGASLLLVFRAFRRRR